MVDRAVPFSEMTPEPLWEAEFHEWYNSEHVPARARAGASDRRAEIAKQPWFKGTYRTFSLMRSFAATHGRAAT